MLFFFCCLRIFSKLTFSKKKKSFRNNIRVSNSLYPDQVQHFVVPDLGSNCLQSYQQTTKVSTSGERVKHTVKDHFEKPK